MLSFYHHRQLHPLPLPLVHMPSLLDRASLTPPEKSNRTVCPANESIGLGASLFWEILYVAVFIIIAGRDADSS